jgi:hypothetical protein
VREQPGEHREGLVACQVDQALVQLDVVVRERGRVTDQVCEAISSGGMTREEGIDLVNRYDGKVDPAFIRRFCAYLGISDAEFAEITERYRNQKIWRQGADGKWSLLL